MDGGNCSFGEAATPCPPRLDESFAVRLIDGLNCGCCGAAEKPAGKEWTVSILRTMGLGGWCGDAHGPMRMRAEAYLSEDRENEETILI